MVDSLKKREVKAERKNKLHELSDQVIDADYDPENVEVKFYNDG